MADAFCRDEPGKEGHCMIALPDCSSMHVCIYQIV